MNVDTCHLILTDKREELESLMRQGYEPIPEELNQAAKIKLAGEKEAYVSLTSGGKLSRWAAKKRRARNKKARESRKRNRK